MPPISGRIRARVFKSAVTSREPYDLDENHRRSLKVKTVLHGQGEDTWEEKADQVRRLFRNRVSDGAGGIGGKCRGGDRSDKDKNRRGAGKRVADSWPVAGTGAQLPDPAPGGM